MDAAAEDLIRLIGITTGSTNVSIFLSDLIGSRTSNLFKKVLSPSVFEGTVNNLLTTAANFGTNIVTGAVNGVVSNIVKTVGGVENSINNAINSVTSSIKAKEKEIIGDINEALSFGSGGDSNKNTPTFPTGGVASNPNSYVEKKVNPDDYSKHIVQRVNNEAGTPIEINTNKSIDENDAPIHFPSTQGEIPVSDENDTPDHNNIPDDIITDQNDYRNSEINHNNVEKSVNQDDYVQNIQLKQNDKQINQDDYVKNLQLKQGDKQINQDDTVNKNNIRYIHRVVGNLEIPINQNDTINKVHSIGNVELLVNTNDTVNKDTIKYVIKTVDPNDTPIH
jgi:hypothetical protein